jgi:uncharacterized protein (DUF1501 family)
MAVTRRQFIRGGAAAFTVSFTAPEFLCDLARAQGARSRSLVVLYLSGGNDALSTVVPYQDPFYFSRRPNISVPAGQVLQIGSDRTGRALGLHPRLTGLRSMFNDGRLAVVLRTGYANSSRSHFEGTDIWESADPSLPSNLGWLGRYLESVPRDALAGWSATRELPRALMSKSVSVPAIPDPRTYALNSPNPTIPAEGLNERAAATRIASHVPVDRPQLAFVNTAAVGAMDTLDRVASVAAYTGTVAYNNNNALAVALRTVAGSIVRGTGTRVYWVTIGGFDTHSTQGNAGGGGYANLMTTVNDAMFAFYNDLRNQGLLNDTMLIEFSEFSRRITENGSQGTDHGAAGIMFAMGGAVRGGIYGTAASLDPASPTLENNGGDVTYETDFRAVYARVLDNWLGANSAAILNGDFRGAAPAIV